MTPGLPVTVTTPIGPSPLWALGVVPEFCRAGARRLEEGDTDDIIILYLRINKNQQFDVLSNLTIYSIFF